MVERLITRLLRTGTRRGLQGSQAWAVIAVLAATARILRKLANPKPEIVWRQRLQPGEHFEVTVR